MTTLTKTSPEYFDIAIIGAGSAGLTMAAVSANLGYNVVLFEKEKMGGDCLNTGCVPSKALLSIAKKKHLGADISFKDAMTHVHNTIAKIAPHDSIERFSSFGTTIVQEPAAFHDKNTLKTPSGRHFTAKRIIIASGSSPATPPVKGLKNVDYLTNESIFTLKDQPKSLAIIGAGPIGVEMAQAFAHLGTQVSLFEVSDRIMPRDDADASQIIHHHLEKIGVKIFTSTNIKNIEESNGYKSITTDKEQHNFTHILVATGRTPNTKKLKLKQAHIETDQRGFIKVNQHHRTSNKAVFAIGDVTGGAQFTHMAGNEAGTVIQRILFGNLFAKTTTIVPWVTYTSPEVAQIGLLDSQAIEKYGIDNIQILKIDGTESDRLIAEGEAENSFLKVMILKKNSKVLGVTAVGPSAGEWISIWSLIMAENKGIGALNKVIAPYPTMWEINKKAVSAFYKEKLYHPRTQKISRFLFKILG